MSQNSHINHLWTKILEKAEELITPIRMDNHVKILEPVELIDRRIILKATTELKADSVMSYCAEQLREAIVRCDVGLSDFKLVVDGSAVYNLDADDELSFIPSANVKKEFTFDSFVVGSSNKFVYAAAKSVAEPPGEG